MFPVYAIEFACVMCSLHWARLCVTDCLSCWRLTGSLLHKVVCFSLSARAAAGAPPSSRLCAYGAPPPARMLRLPVHARFNAQWTLRPGKVEPRSSCASCFNLFLFSFGPCRRGFRARGPKVFCRNFCPKIYNIIIRVALNYAATQMLQDRSALRMGSLGVFLCILWCCVLSE